MPDVTGNWWDALPLANSGATPASGAGGAPASGFGMVQPHAAPDGSGAMTNLSDPDYARFVTGQPPAAAPAVGKGVSAASVPPAKAQGQQGDWWKTLPLASEAAPASMPGHDAQPGSTWGGIVRNLAAGANEQIAGALASPFNLANRVLNLPIEGINALTGAGLPTLPTDAAAPIERGMEAVGIHTATVPTNGEGERAARAAGAAIASVPLMALEGARAEAALPALTGGASAALRAVSPGAASAVENAGRVAAGAARAVREMPVASSLLPAAGGAVAGQIAADNVPEPYRGAADLAANLAAGGALALGQEGLAATGRAVGRGAGMMGLGPKATVGGVPVTSVQADAAAQRLAAASGAPEEFRSRLASAPEELVPGSAPTTAQMVQMPGIANLEQSARLATPAPFNERGEAQNRARVGAIEGLQPAGNTGAVGQWFTRQLDALEARGQQDVGAARGVVGSATDALGGHGSPQGYGAGMRAAIEAELEPVQQKRRRLWGLVDPEGTLALAAPGVRQTARQLMGELTASDSLTAPERAALQHAAGLPDVVGFRDLSTLRSNVSDAMRQSLAGEPLSTRGARRLTILKRAIDQAIQDAVEQKAQQEAEAVAAGTLAPEQTMVGRVQSWVDDAEANQSRQVAAGGVHRGGAEPTAGGAPAGDAGLHRAAGNPGGGPGGVAGRAGLQANARQPVSLLSFLTAKGGIRDEGGELAAMDAGKQRVAFLRRQGGLSPDYAREAAEEAGYLKPGTDLNDLWHAIREELAGRRVYPNGSGAEIAQAQQAGSDAVHEAAAMADARAHVVDVEEAAGLHLTPAEIEHATRLVALGEHPHQAVFEATRATEETDLERDPTRHVWGKAMGVDPAAAQSELAMQGGRAGLTPNFDAEAADRYRAARQATLEEKQRFGQGPVGKALAGGRGGALYRVSDSNVVRQFLTRGADEPEAVRRYIQAVGSRPDAVRLARDALVSELREGGIIRPDGTLDTARFDRWRQRRGRTIALFDELGRGFDTAAAAQRTLDETAARHEEAVRDFQNGAARHFLGGDDPLVAVRKAFGSGNPTETFRRLVALTRGSADAEAGLRRAVVEYIRRRMSSTAPAGADGVDFLKAAEFRKWIAANKGPLRVLFGGQGLNNLEMVAADLRRAAQRTAASPGSDTAQKLLNAKKGGFLRHEGTHMTVLALIGEHIGEALHGSTLGGVVGAVAGPALGHLVHAMRQKGIGTVNDLITEAMLHPSVARELMARVPSGQVTPMLQRRLAAALLATSAADLGRQESPSAPQPR